MKLLELLGSILFVLQVQAQESRYQRSSIALIDGSYSNKQMLLPADVSNPSSLSKLHHFAASAEMEATYLLKDASLFSALMVLPAGRMSIGSMVVHNGSPGLTESTIN